MIKSFIEVIKLKKKRYNFPFNGTTTCIYTTTELTGHIVGLVSTLAQNVIA